MTILIDHCVPRRYQRLLDEWGYETYLTIDYLPADATDKRIIEFLLDKDYVLLTIDKGFANVTDYPPGKYPGIIVLRHKSGDEVDLDQILQMMLRELYRDQLRGTLVIVSPGRYRTRRSQE